MSLVSTYVVCERLSVMHKQVSGWTVNFCPNSPESPFLEFQTRKPHTPSQMKNFRFEMTKVYSGIPPPPNEKLQIWDDQSLLQNTPPKWKYFRFEMTKVYSGIPPKWKTSDLRWPKFTLEYPPPRKACNPGDRMWRLICIPRRYHSFMLFMSCAGKNHEIWGHFLWKISRILMRFC